MFEACGNRVSAPVLLLSLCWASPSLSRVGRPEAQPMETTHNNLCLGVNWKPFSSIYHLGRENAKKRVKAVSKVVPTVRKEQEG